MEPLLDKLLTSSSAQTLPFLSSLLLSLASAWAPLLDKVRCPDT